MIENELTYSAGQLENDLEYENWIVHHPFGVGHVSIYDDNSGLVYSYGGPVPYLKTTYKKALNDVLQVTPVSSYLKSYEEDKRDYNLILIKK